LSKLGLKLLVLGALIAAALGIVACGDSSSKEGGTLTGSYASFPDYLDPQLSYTQEGWTAMYDTYLPLLTYKRANGEEGSEVVPGLAEDLPKISSDGKTYELTLRKGLKYSDGKPVKASDFKSSMERMFKINSPGFYYYESIVGAEKFAETKQGGIPGIETDDKTGKITIELTAPRGTFTNELGMLFAAVLPAGTPASNVTNDPPPATGPYVITESEPGRSWSYERNPYWAKANSQIETVDAGSFDKVEMTVVRNDATIVNEVERDKTMWMQPLVPSDQRQRIIDKYEGTQFRIEYPINSYLFWMNTDKAPFDDVKVRQAVNHAVDSAALERIYAGSLGTMRQILPDGMPGHDEELDLYPHDMAKAKEMFKEANPSDTDITVWTNDENPNDEAGAYYQDVLTKLGFNAKLKTINADNYYAILGNESTPDLDTGWLAWLADYPNPNNYFQPLLSGEAIAPTNNTNFARIDVPELNERITKLSEEPLGPEQTEEYRELNREFMELAPWAPYGTNTISTFVNSEIDLDKVVYNPTFGHSLTSFELK
jgi:peptide/nickel transport system substrate-binding protein